MSESQKPITVEQLDALTQKFLDAKSQQEEAERAADNAKAYTRSCQSEVIGALEQLGKTLNEGSFGKVSIVQREYYKVLDKEATYDWLRKRGEFDDLASVNANTLSSHVKKIVHERREQENDFVWVPPGMVDSTSDYKYLKHTKPKG